MLTPLDPDNDPLTYLLITGPQGMAINQASGLLAWNLTPTDAGQHDVTIRVDDGRGGLAEQHFTVTVLTQGACEIHGTVLNQNGTFGAATQVNVANRSFEVPDLPDGAFCFATPFGDTTIPNWSMVVSGYSVGVFDPAGQYAGSTGNTTPLPGSGDGDQVAFINLPFGGSGDITSGVVTTTQANAQYSLTVAVGHRLDLSVGDATIALLSDGKVVASSTIPGWALPSGSFTDLSTSFVAATSDEELQIQLSYSHQADGAESQVNFDNVRLTARTWAPLGLEGWTVYLDQNQNGRRDVGEPSTTTDANGDYTFTALPPGTYVVAEDLQPRWTQMAPIEGTYQVAISGDEVVTGKDFHNLIVPSGNNQDPAITSTAPVAMTLGQTYRYDARATDPENDPLQFDLPIKAPGMAVDPTSGTVVWQPTADQVGTRDVILRVRDGHGGVALQPFRITVSPVNHSPVIATEPIPSVALDGTYRYDVDAIDPDNDPLTYSLTLGPEGMDIDAASGVVTWNQPKGFGTSLKFDGVDDYVDIPNSLSLNALGDYTIELWVKPNSCGVGWYSLIDKRDPNNTENSAPYGIWLHNDPDAGYRDALDWFIGDKTSGYVDLSINDFFTGEYGRWVHVAVVLNGTVMRVYRNGVLQQSGSYSGVRVGNSASVEIGRYHSSSGSDYCFSGALDELRIWNVARTSVEVADNYAHVVDLTSVGLVGYWQFDEGSGRVSHDATDSGNLATLGGDGEGSDLPTWMSAGNPSNPGVLANKAVFYDGTFNPADWQETDFVHGRISPDSYSRGTHNSSTGNPGEYFQVFTGVASAPSNNDYSSILGFYKRVGATYDPREWGAVFSIDYSEDVVGFSGEQAFGPALMQSGQLYYCHAGSVGPGATWGAKELRNLRASDFTLVGPAQGFEVDLEAHPDFSENGAPLEFGFFRRVSTAYGYGGSSSTGGIDNWTVIVTPVQRVTAIVSVNDGRGGTDHQTFSVTVSQPSGIQGFNFHDLNHDGAFDREAYTIVGGWEGLLRFDAPTSALIDVFTSGVPVDTIGGLAFGPDGDLYVGGASGNQVLRFDGKTGAFKRVFVSDPNLISARGLTFGPDGNLYVSSHGTDSIRRYSGNTGGIPRHVCLGVEWWTRQPNRTQLRARWEPVRHRGTSIA